MLDLAYSCIIKIFVPLKKRQYDIWPLGYTQIKVNALKKFLVNYPDKYSADLLLASFKFSYRINHVEP